MKKYILLFIVLFVISSVISASSLSESIDNDIKMLNEIVNSIKSAVEIVDLANTNDSMYRNLQTALDRIEIRISSMNSAKKAIPKTNFRSISKNTSTPVSTLSKETGDLLFSELNTVIGIANSDDVTDSLIAKTDYDTYLKILSPIVIDYQGSIISQNLEKYSESLRRYEMVYGADAPKLNFLETGIYLLFLQRVPGFGPTENEGPGALELILSYNTAYMSVYDTDTKESLPPNPVRSMFEIGLRKYFFQKGWGTKSGRAKYLKPAYGALGIVVAGQQKGALAWPLSGKQKYGVFGAWGKIKAAYIFGDNGSILLSKQFATIPYLF